MELINKTKLPNKRSARSHIPFVSLNHVHLIFHWFTEWCRRDTSWHVVDDDARPIEIAGKLIWLQKRNYCPIGLAKHICGIFHSPFQWNLEIVFRLNTNRVQKETVSPWVAFAIVPYAISNWHLIDTIIIFRFIWMPSAALNQRRKKSRKNSNFLSLLIFDF